MWIVVEIVEDVLVEDEEVVVDNVFGDWFFVEFDDLMIVDVYFVVVWGWMYFGDCG